MGKIYLLIAALCFVFYSEAQTYKYQDFTSERTDGKTVKDKRNKSDRGDIRVKNFEETKLLNFYNIAGIRFQNIAANDAVITSKINTMTEEEWELAFVSSAVESDAGKNDGRGIFITRYIFKKLKGLYNLITKKAAFQPLFFVIHSSLFLDD